MNEPIDRTECGGLLVLGVGTHESGGLVLRVSAKNLDTFAYMLRVFLELYIDQAMRLGDAYAWDKVTDALTRLGWTRPFVQLTRPKNDGRKVFQVTPIRMVGGAVSWGIVQYPEGAPLRARVVPPGPETMSAADVVELLDLWCGQWCGWHRGTTLELIGRDHVINRFWTVEGVREGLTSRLEVN